MLIVQIYCKIYNKLLHLYWKFSRLCGPSGEGTSFALEWAKTSYRIASGTKDYSILIWDFEDNVSRMTNGIILGSTKRELASIYRTDNIKLYPKV